MIKIFSEWIIDTLVTSVLIIISIFLCGMGFVCYPAKNVRNFFGRQAMRMINTIDAFLDDRDEEDEI